MLQGIRFIKADKFPAISFPSGGRRNLAARTMYSKFGYQEITIVPTVFNGIPGVNLVLLEKQIRNGL